jgi:hypothetical protein
MAVDGAAGGDECGKRSVRGGWFSEGMTSLSLPARLFLLASALKWRVHGVHGMPAACRGPGAGGVVNAEARGKEGRWVTEPELSLGASSPHTHVRHPASHAALVVPDHARLAVSPR